MTSTSQPVPIPGRESPQDKSNEGSPASSQDISPSSSAGSKRKRDNDEEQTEPSQDRTNHPNKRRKTPPIEFPKQNLETPRMGQIQKRVEEMKVNRSNDDSGEADIIENLSKDTKSSDSEPEPAAEQVSESHEEVTQDPASQQESVPPVDVPKSQEEAEEASKDIETDGEEAAPLVDAEMSNATRRRANGLKRIPNLDRPIEIDPQEYNRKRKASEKLAGSPFSSPLPKRAKESESSMKSTISEEANESEKPSSTTINQQTSPQAPLKGFSAFASANPFAAVKSDNAPFTGGTRPSSLFDGSVPKFRSPFPTYSSFSTPKSSEVPSVFKEKEEDNGTTQGLAKDGQKTPFPSTSTSPMFGAPSAAAGSEAPKSVFGRTSTFGAPSSPSPSTIGPTRRAKSPRPQAFGAYAATAGRFAAPSSKIRAKNKAEGETGDEKEAEEANSSEEKIEEKQKTFSEILAATGSDAEVSDDGEKMVFVEQETTTGEEDELNVFHGRGKLYYMVDGQWKERGPGLFKLNVNRDTGLSPRIVMRRDGALNLILNAKLFKGMKFAAGPDPRYVTFTILDEDLKPKSHLLRFHTAKLAQDLLDRIPPHIPT